MVGRLPESDHASRRGGEATRFEIEAGQIVVEVDMKPLAARGSCLLDGERDEAATDPAPTMASGDERIEEEGVATTVPRDIHESDESVTVAGDGPAEAVSLDLGAPVVCVDRVVEAFRMEALELDAVTVAAPGDAHVHGTGRRAQSSARFGASQRAATSTDIPLRCA
jgi:hypothetical protein